MVSDDGFQEQSGQSRNIVEAEALVGVFAAANRGNRSWSWVSGVEEWRGAMLCVSFLASAGAATGKKKRQRY